MILITLALGWAIVFGWIYLYLDPVRCKPANLITRLVDYLLKGTIMAATFEEVKQLALDNKQLATELLDVVNAEDLKLDEIRAYIAALVGGGVITQAQLDELGGLLTEAKDIVTAGKVKATDNLAETDALDQ